MGLRTIIMGQLGLQFKELFKILSIKRLNSLKRFS